MFYIDSNLKFFLVKANRILCDCFKYDKLKKQQKHLEFNGFKIILYTLPKSTNVDYYNQFLQTHRHKHLLLNVLSNVPPRCKHKVDVIVNLNGACAYMVLLFKKNNT